MKKTKLFYLLAVSLLLNIILVSGVFYYYRQFRTVEATKNYNDKMMLGIWDDYVALQKNYETLRGTAQNMLNDLARLSSQPARIVIPPSIQMPQWHNVNCNTFGSTVNCSGF